MCTIKLILNTTKHINQDKELKLKDQNTFKIPIENQEPIFKKKKP